MSDPILVVEIRERWLGRTWTHRLIFLSYSTRQSNTSDRSIETCILHPNGWRMPNAYSRPGGHYPGSRKADSRAKPGIGYLFPKTGRCAKDNAFIFWNSLCRQEPASSMRDLVICNLCELPCDYSSHITSLDILLLSAHVCSCRPSGKFDSTGCSRRE